MLQENKKYMARVPGDVVEVDKLDVRPLPGVILKHFTARDIISSWDVLEAHSRASSHTASGFIDTLPKRMPFPCYLEILELNQALLKWENVYNTIRPYQALGYLTPQQFLKQYQENKGKGMRCH